MKRFTVFLEVVKLLLKPIILIPFYSVNNKLVELLSQMFNYRLKPGWTILFWDFVMFKNQ